MFCYSVFKWFSALILRIKFYGTILHDLVNKAHVDLKKCLIGYKRIQLFNTYPTSLLATRGSGVVSKAVREDRRQLYSAAEISERPGRGSFTPFRQTGKFSYYFCRMGVARLNFMYEP